ncbi:hypothetical protein Hanom_Chr07g00620201 [Helianthus anomalus]
MGSISKSKTQESRCLLRLTKFSRAGVVLIDRLVHFIKPGCLPLIQFSSHEFKETLMKKGSFHHQIHKSQSILVSLLHISTFIKGVGFYYFYFCFNCIFGLQFSASDLQTLDRNFLSLATLNMSWKRFATVKALNVQNDSVVPSAATVFAHGMYV